MEETISVEENIENQDSQNKKPKSNFLNLFLGFIIIVLAFIMYQFGNFDGISSDELKNDFIKKSDVSFRNIQNRDDYILKSTHLSELKKSNNTNTKIVEKIVEKIVYKDKIIQSEPKIIEKVVYKDKIIQSKPKILEVEKIVKLSPQTIYKDREINKSKFNVFKCYGMSPSNYRLSEKCTSDLKSFLKENSNSKYFEVIAVMNPADFRTIMILKQKEELLKEIDLSVEQISQLKNLTSIGLDKLRVVETMWEVKTILGKNTIVVPVSYNVNSKKNRGTIIRAYKN